MSEETQGGVEEASAQEDFVIPDPEDFMLDQEDIEPDMGGESEEQPLSEVEEKAYHMGWRPLEQFEGDKDTWIDAKEFVGRAPLYEGLSKQSKEIKQMKAMLDELTTVNQRIKENAKKEALEEIRKQRVEAMQNEDYNTALALEDKEKELAQEEGENPQQPQQETEAFIAWKAKNDWFESDLDMQVFANGYGARWLQDQKAGGTEPTEAELYDAVEQKVKEVFAHKFQKPKPNLNRGAAPGGQSANSAGGGVKDRWHKLTDDQKRMARDFERTGVMKVKQYIDSLEEAGMLGG